MQLILPHTPRVEDPSALTGPGRGACASAGRLGGRARSAKGPGCSLREAQTPARWREGSEAAEHASRVRKGEVWPEAWGLRDKRDGGPS